MTWRRFDTLFLRLFVLMWVTLVASHFIAFSVVMGQGQFPRGDAAPGAAQRFRPDGPHLPVLPSLPPGNPFATGDGAAARGPEGAPPRAMLPRAQLWLDYAIRLLVIALAAAVGAHWLARPMRRLAAAAGGLAGAVAGREPLPLLDERKGTTEVRQAAQVFNAMAQRLQQQFDSRGMHMAALSHDLRTPLTRLRMRVENMPNAQAAVADVREMDDMIHGTLAILREQQDGVEPRPLDLAALLQAACDDFTDQGQAAALRIEVPLRARGHPASLRRIVDNLIANAIKYGGGARVWLVHGADGMVEVLVDDDGPGIAADDLQRAFEPWVRLRSTESRAGHGLGLAVARDLARRSGGDLLLQNRFEGGLRARLLLPRA